MKVEHLTLGGTSVMRDTLDINLHTMSIFKELRISYDSKLVKIAELPFYIKITATDEGAAFDIQKDGQIAISNYCCFNAEKSETVIYYVNHLVERSPLSLFKVQMPKNDKWIYSVPIIPFTLSFSEMQIAGEVELYIYYQLYLAWKMWQKEINS